MLSKRNVTDSRLTAIGRRTAIALTAGLLAALLTPTAPAQALAKVQCKPSVGYGRIDPIAARGMRMAPHMHEFFGNKALRGLPQPQNATYRQLVGRATNCENKGDSAAYWAPALLVGGKRLPAERFIAYYRSFDHEDRGAARAFPPNMRLITPRADWSCGQFTSTYLRNSIPDCSKASGNIVWLTVHYTFPSCWDGKMNDHSQAGNTADFAPSGVKNHLAFFKKGTRSTCPPKFPIELAELRETVSWGNGNASYWKGKSNVRLATDMPGQRPGTSAHADFWNTWRQPALERLLRSCVQNRPTAKARCG